MARFFHFKAPKFFIMNTRTSDRGQGFAHFDPLDDFEEILRLGSLLGQRRAFAAVGGHCSAAQAELLRRIRDEKLYLPLAPSWRAFCPAYVAISRRPADRLISLLNRFGAPYFQLSQLVGITPEQYLAIEPAVREDNLLIDGEAIGLIPENTPRITTAIRILLSQSEQPKLRDLSAQSVAARLAHLLHRGRAIANQLLSLYESSSTAHDRELILEGATELRLILLQLGIDSPPGRRGA